MYVNTSLTIETERLILRPFTPNDLHDFSLICADPEVMRFIGLGKTLDKETVEQQMMSWIASYQEHGFGLLAVTLKDTKRLIGFCGLLPQTVDGKSYLELGYRLERDSWNKGIATEAAKSIKNDARQRLKIPYLISIIHFENFASKNVAQKIGMNLMKKTDFKGIPVDIYYSDLQDAKRP